MATFGKLPINGEIQHSTHRQVKQRTAAELYDMLVALLREPNVKSIGWQQYTPYFNDGDPCVFSAYLYGVKFENVPAPYEDEFYEDEDEEFHEESWHDRYSLQPLLHKGGYPEAVTESVLQQVDTLQRSISSGEFDNVLLQYFGDHALVVVTADGIEVIEYEHE